MYPCTCALILALMKPSSVATRSSTRGTSCGCTVVTSTSGGGAAVCAGLREQPVANETAIRSKATQITGFIDALLLIGSRISSEDRHRAKHLVRHTQHLFRMIPRIVADATTISLPRLAAQRVNQQA